METSKTPVTYDSPSLFFIELEAEETTMAVTSGSQEWYNQAGEGDFTYTIEEDTTWK